MATHFLRATQARARRFLTSSGAGHIDATHCHLIWDYSGGEILGLLRCCR